MEQIDRGKKPVRPRVWSASDVDSILRRLVENQPVRRSLPDWGRLHIDRQLPFICVYRNASRTGDDATHQLLLGTASYCLAPGNRSAHPALTELLRRIAVTMVERFGGFLIVEIWAEPPETNPDGQLPPEPRFHVYHDPRDAASSTLAALQTRLTAVREARRVARVDLHPTHRIAPQRLPQLLPRQELRTLGCHLLGIGVRPIYADPQTGNPYPLVIRSFRRQLGRALAQTFYEFAREQTTHRPPHYHALGRRAMVKAVWQVDRALADVSNAFDLLLQVTPVNSDRAWRQFRAGGFTKPPAFLYRPRLIDPGRMKHALYGIPIDRVEDPVLVHLFLEKQESLDRELTLIHDLGRPQFMYEGLQLYGHSPNAVLQLAEQILDAPAGRNPAEGECLDAGEFLGRAEAEIQWYRSQDPNFKGTAELRPDLFAGLMVSRGRLLVGKDARIPVKRAEALIQHEVGTHLLTYHNGRAQPFKMLCSGLPGYEELQEGLAVLSEYLVGGLSRSRLRILAARVVAVNRMTQGASFPEVFRLLHRTYGFTQRPAFTITTRVFRGGGLPKDAIYLRGFHRILKYIADGGDFQRLFVGKIAVAQLPVVEELLLRKILVPPPLRPRYLDSPEAQARLKRVSAGISVLDMAQD